MGEEVAGLPEDPAVGPATRAGVRDAALAEEVEAEPIGAYLSRQRRLRRIGLDELARVTCIPLRSLERLESGAFDGTPDGFARGFVRTVALALGLDPDETVGRMLPEARPSSRRRVDPLPEPTPWLAAILVVLGLAAFGVALVEGRPGPPDPSAVQYVYRRDAVRELARAQGLVPPQGTVEISAPDEGDVPDP